MKLSNCELENNIRAYYLLSTPNEKEQGLDWYKNARSVCVRLSKQHDIPLPIVVGILAGLSPRNRWNRNVSDTEQVILLGAGATVGTFNDNKAKAVRILNGENALDVLSGNKVRSFYNCIISKYSDDVCIDSHTYAVAVGNGTRVKPSTISDTEYSTIQDAFQTVAETLKIEPKQLQATTWLTYRRIHKIH